MESKKNNDERRLCGNCAQFYGTVDTDFLCSKCFKESKASTSSPKKMAPIQPVQACSDPVEPKVAEFDSKPASLVPAAKEEAKAEENVEMEDAS